MSVTDEEKFDYKIKFEGEIDLDLAQENFQYWIKLNNPESEEWKSLQDICGCNKSFSV